MKSKILTTAFILLVIVFTQFVSPESALASRICGVTNSNIYYVDADSTFESPDGCSWETAYKTLQDALADSTLASGDQIWVAAGTYYPDQGAGQTDNNRASTFTLKSGLSIYGGFAGGETLLSQRNVAANVTILSGDIDQVAGNTNNAYHVVTGVALTSSAVLDGFTITDGNANAGDNYGGGMNLHDSSPTLRNLIFDNNAGGNGGGLAGFASSNASLTDVAFSNNSVGIHGGGIYLQGGSNLTLLRVTFSTNTSVGYGGGMAVFTSSPSLTDVTFDSNRTTGAGNPGGGMYNSESTPVLNRVTFSNNRAENAGGGGMYNYLSNVVMTTNVTFANNYAYRRGGAMANETSSPILNNVTMTGNSVTVQASGGMANFLNSDPVIRNSILWGDTPQEIVNDDTATDNPQIFDSIVQGGCPAGAGSTCTNVLNADPNLVALANNGGFTQTMALGVGSSAIDAGNTATCAATDQRGITRPLGAACDAGAFEALTYVLTVTTVGNGTVTRSNPGPYFPGDIVNLTPVPDLGSSFLGWSGACTGTGACSVTMDGNKVVTATFTMVALPAAFDKGSPADGLTGVAANPILNWLPSSGMDNYEYCYDTTDDDNCSSWITTSVRKNMLSGLSPATTYYWQARAVNSTGTTYANGSETSYWSFTTANLPGSYGKALLTNGSTGVSVNPSLTWGGSSDATTYEYCYDTTNDGGCSTWTNNGGARNVTLSGLSPATTYYWQVRASNTFGIIYANGAETAYWSFTTVTPPGSFGKGVPASGQTGVSINPSLTWGGSSGASSYEYCYDTTNDGNCSTWTNSAGARSVTLSGLSPATTYYWQVRAKNSTGTTYANGAETAYWSFATVTPPGSFGKGVPASGQTGISINPTLTWGASSGASSYEYCYDTTDDGTCGTWTNNGGARYVTLNGLSPATTYYWQARAKNSFGTTYANGAETAYWSFTTITPPGSFGKGIPASGQTGISINPTLTWGASSGASSYEYCYDTTDDGTCGTWTNNGGARYVILSGLTPGTIYYWQVRANNSAGITYANGSETAYWSFTTATPPGAFSKTTPVNGSTGLSTSPMLIWGPSSGASSYEYCYDTTDDGTCGTWTNNGGARYVYLSGLTPGTIYYWQVRANNSAGITYANGSETAHWSFTITP